MSKKDEKIENLKEEVIMSKKDEKIENLKEEVVSLQRQLDTYKSMVVEKARREVLIREAENFTKYVEKLKERDEELYKLVMDCHPDVAL